MDGPNAPFNYLKVATLLAVLVVTCSAEVYLSHSELQGLVHTESALVSALERYLHKQTVNLQQFTRLYSSLKERHEETISNIEEYLSSPINAYLFIKRLVFDFQKVEKLVFAATKEYVKEKRACMRGKKLPEQKDLYGAAEGLMRLQNLYRLDLSSMAKGEFPGIRNSTPLSAKDCLHIGRLAYMKEQFLTAQKWLQHALNKCQEEKDAFYKETKATILEYLAITEYCLENAAEALKLTDDLLRVNPDHSKAKGNKMFLEEEVMQVLPSMRSGQVLISPTGKLPDTIEESLTCRGIIWQNSEATSKLTCRFEHNNNPFLRIAPFKKEELNLKPKIIMFKEVLSNSEIEVIKNLSIKAKMVKSEAENDDENEPTRVSKQTWLEDSADPVIARLSRRIEDMTGLCTLSSEELQVVNYGIGGHFSYHYDFFSDDFSKYKADLNKHGDRMATLLFYLSDVDSGGGTAFPYLKLNVKPEKGSAILWYNLKNNGEPDLDTLHSSCPVLAGNKWIANKWLHERGQEFRKPCIPGEEN